MKSPTGTMTNQSLEGDVWNLPVREFPDRANTYWDLIKGALLPTRPLDILEVGVYKAALLRGLLKRTDIPVGSYTGVDPYLGDARDPYTDVYWSSENEAGRVWREAKAVFEGAGHTLVRSCSHEFYARATERTWDLIIIDGDHRQHAALWDLHHWFKRVRPGGVMVADDYASADTPEVTLAVNSFLKLNQANVERSGYRVLPFQNQGKEIPISLTIVAFKRTANPVETKSWAFDSLGSADMHPVRRFVRRFGLDLHRIRRA